MLVHTHTHTHTHIMCLYPHTHTHIQIYAYSCTHISLNVTLNLRNPSTQNKSMKVDSKERWHCLCAAVCCVFLQKPRCQLPLELKEGRTNRAGMLTGCTPAGRGAQSWSCTERHRDGETRPGIRRHPGRRSQRQGEEGGGGGGGGGGGSTVAGEEQPLLSFTDV